MGDLAEWAEKLEVDLEDTEGTDLDLAEKELGEVPCDILEGLLGKFEAVECIYFDENGLTSLPAALCAMAKLKELNATKNKLQALPQDLGNLSNLEGMLVAENELTGLPESIGGCLKLTGFNVGNNKLVRLPDSLCKCTSMEGLYGDYNVLEELPARTKPSRQADLRGPAPCSQEEEGQGCPSENHQESHRW